MPDHKQAGAKVFDKMLRVTQVRSPIGGTRRQRESLKGLGLTRVGSSAIVPDNPSTRGLVRCVQHLVAIEE